MLAEHAQDVVETSADHILPTSLFVIAGNIVQSAKRKWSLLRLI